MMERMTCDPPQTVSSYYQTFFEGFNPYGNGQPIMSEPAWVKANTALVAKKNRAEITAMYNNYVAKKKGKPKPKSPVGPNRQETTKRFRATGMDDRRIKVQMSGCADMYYAALTCPFWWQDQRCPKGKLKGLKLNAAKNPCIPMFPTVKSRKSYAFAKGSCGILNAGDTGWILMSPFRFFNDPSANNVDPAILFSNGTIPWPTKFFPTIDTGAAWTSGYAGFATDYSKADLLTNGNGVGPSARPVACAVRVRYVGNELNRAGIYKGITDPNHDSLGDLTEVEIGQFDSFYSDTVDVVARRVDDPWFTIGYCPISDNEYQYHPDPIANDLWPNSAYNHSIGIMIIGAPPGENFEWQAILHYEATGAAIRSKTATECDPMGTAAVSSAVTPESMGHLANTTEPIKPTLTKEASMMTVVNGATEAVAKVLPGFEGMAMMM